MQGAKVGWIADNSYRPQLLADLQRTARLGSSEAVMTMVREVSHDGFADFLINQGLQNAFINTLKMEPHYGGWMHGRTHGFLPIENGAIAHDINHLTVLGWDQNQPFMNDTFDWPQWPALEVSDNRVINYFQSMVALGAPLESNLDGLGTGAPAPPTQPEPDSPPPTEVNDGEVSDEEPWVDTNPESTTNPDPVTGVDVAVGGQLWWGGLTASLAVTNTSEQTVENWGVQFSSDHRFYGDAWGMNVESSGSGGWRVSLRRSRVRLGADPGGWPDDPGGLQRAHRNHGERQHPTHRSSVGCRRRRHDGDLRSLANDAIARSDDDGSHVKLNSIWLCQ